MNIPSSGLPPTPTRRKWLRWLALPVAVSILLTTYYLARPPELVWWTSPPTPPTGARIRVLIPGGWEMLPGSPVKLRSAHSYTISAPYQRWFLLRWILPGSRDGSMRIGVPDVRD